MNTRERFPFHTDAIVLLPDHIHCIWTLPENDDYSSLRWKESKGLFTKGYLAHVGPGRKAQSIAPETGGNGHVAE